MNEIIYISFYNLYKKNIKEIIQQKDFFINICSVTPKTFEVETNVFCRMYFIFKNLVFLTDIPNSGKFHYRIMKF